MILLYSHSGSFNHGCEALVRSIIKRYPNEKFLVQSNNPEEDKAFGISEIATVVPLGKRFSEQGWIQLFLARVFRTLFGTELLYWHGINKPIEKYLKSVDYALSIGGDNYCYTVNGFLDYQNKYFHRRKIKTILYGASINEDALTHPVLADLKRYDLITARETVTYKSLIRKGLANVQQTIDTAFFLDTEAVELKEIEPEKNYIGINASPLLKQYESGNNIVYESFLRLIRWILAHTDSHIVLLPHVTIRTNNDLTILRKLAEECQSERIHIISDDESLNCMQLKYAVSKCEFVVAARTHISIAAYSSSVPCLVAGYSVKSIGIARDLFGTERNYVINCNEMKTGDELTEAFREMYAARKEERKKLETIIPVYQKCFYNIPELTK